MHDGMASDYIYTTNTNPTAGVRFQILLLRLVN